MSNFSALKVAAVASLAAFYWLAPPFFADSQPSSPQTPVINKSDLLPSANKVSQPKMVVCTIEDEICFLPTSWQEAQAIARAFDEAGAVFFPEGTLAYEIAREYTSGPGGDYLWPDIILARN